MYHTSRRKYYRLDGFLFLGNEEERLRTAIQHMWWQIVMCSLRILLTTSRRNNISNSCRNTISTGQRADYLKQPENISQTAGENSISNNRRNKYHPKQPDEYHLRRGQRTDFLKQPENISQTAEENSISNNRRKYRFRTAGENSNGRRNNISNGLLATGIDIFAPNVLTETPI